MVEPNEIPLSALAHNDPYDDQRNEGNQRDKLEGSEAEKRDHIRHPKRGEKVPKTSASNVTDDRQRCHLQF
ncbi:MAG TPA: hypothetical protein VK797_13195 [Tepidisphaeraceae bacterium]|jgi:hypothetical protein|nr:hypothetical protein [Tepidisphaeraceae bacterium]